MQNQKPLSSKTSPKNSIDITIAGQRYALKGDESQEHLREVAELVRRRVDSIKKKHPTMALHKIAMLAAFDFASETIKGRKRALDYRSEILSRAGALLQKMQCDQLPGHEPG